MDARHRKERHDRRVAHQRQQRKRKEAALEKAEQVARYSGSDGKTLKRPRTGTKYEAAYWKAMADLGYRPDGRGGWRPKAKQQVKKELAKD